MDVLIAGIIIGTFYALLALGLSLIFGILKVVNFAHGEFATVRNQIYYVTILKRNYVGAIHELQFTDNPLTIATIGAGDTESPIKPQELTLRLNVTSDPLFLLAVNSFEYQIKVAGGGMDWEGYIVADQWSEPFLPPPYTIEVRFVDGLSLLKNFMFADAHCDSCDLGLIFYSLVLVRRP